MGEVIAFQNFCFRIEENIRRDFAVVYHARLVQFFLEGLIVEVVAAERIAHMHIYNAPRCKDGFFVWILEFGHYLDNALCSVGWRQFVCGFRHFSDTKSRADNNVFIVVSQNIKEQLFAEPFWHKLSPRLVVNDFYKVLQVNYFGNIRVCTVKQTEFGILQFVSTCNHYRRLLRCRNQPCRLFCL